MRATNLYQARSLSGQMQKWAYNALDCIATMAVRNVLRTRLTPAAERTYAFERAAQLPAFAMSTRGIRVNVQRRMDVVAELKREFKKGEKALNKLPELAAVWDGTVKVTGLCKKSTRKDGRHTWAKKEPDTPARLCVSCGTSRFEPCPLNANSDTQVRHLMYDLLGAPIQRNKNKEVSVDDDCLDRIGRKKPALRPITDAIRNLRGLKKQIGFLSARLTPDNRYGSAFNIGAAWTGRMSSNRTAFGEGGNSQNIAERHRIMFEADPGMELCYIDLKTAESNVVAHLAGDEGYIEAHLLGDPHTYVARLLWPELPWTGKLAEDKAVAKVLPEWDPVPGHEFRFQAKRIQHGSNYGLRPMGIAMIAHIPIQPAKTAFYRYHSAFPRIKPWQDSIAKKVREKEVLVNPLGITVQLFGRPWDEHTVKQGLSFLPQSTVAHVINIAMWRLYIEMDPHEIQLLAQVHDAILFQFPKGRYDLVRKAMKLMSIPIDVTDYEGHTRRMTIDVEAAVGLNWGKQSKENPDGIKDFH